ncbi:MAG: sigma-54 dependent transcriptional regulator [candidate division KSB1 bacterium]|nr:sigma-54 dependent transcriptional regulator [candidate division KSB1 bacterium]MDZ7274303.1 sigma-54 dependent transcriptional regulator [candidate division KSB1 bacterium]MDZ7287175.1 sigma-54 dependent transcriptional regulator [candidate division KSB1 bacterium]MDZ7296900.1 sigma-54 dependent transcriptional regulator [candidate division KSB1 bacterium]MDZ7309609.1 sigma-54 dependent transcriptional regulator [candidate division KSB1 bacterium]
MQEKSILIVDDEESVRDSLERVLRKAGYVTRSASSGEEALALMSAAAADIVLTDLRMPDGDGMNLLKSLKKKYPDVEVIVLTGYGTIETAVEAIKEGAYDFITKPPKKAVILSTVERAIERQNLAQENKYLKAQLGRGDYEEIIGRSQAFQQVMQMVERVAPLISTVLITGESGTGKELIARAIHRKSPRAKNRFIPVNSAAIPENLIESELFGHVKGAFTGAMRDKQGLFKVADGGTLFLDEISSVPLNLQVKLLRAIEQKEILPVGSTRPEIIDVRIIAATNKDLAAEVAQGNFREDLYYRLNVVGINIPPLRERVEDIPELVNHFIKVYNAQLNKQIRGAHEAVLNAFKTYEWKGNVRELENVVERAMIMCDSDMLQLAHFPPMFLAKPGLEEVEGGLKGSVRKFERDAIFKALQAAGQDKSKAASLLGMSLSTLYRKMAELGIPSKE